MVPEPQPGTVIAGRYELVEVAGRGGMADVWRGRVCGDWGFSRPIAIKRMHAALALQTPYVKMFVEEARVGAALQSPNLAEVHDFVAEDGNYFMIMEWIDGIDLGTWIKWHAQRGESTGWELVAAIGVGIARGLGSAHERQTADGAVVPVVHRDVSPHNVLLTTRGVVKVIDFGLALTADRPEETTDAGVVKGKMSYLAPEIVSGGRPMPSSDQFASGSVLWESLVGRKLFDGQTDYETFVKLRECRVPPLRALRPDVPPGLVTVIQRALSAQSAERFPSVRDMGRELSMVIRRAHSGKDLHGLLARSVVEARRAMGLGLRADDPSAVTPVAEITPTAAAAASARSGAPKVSEALAGPARGLRHRLAALVRRW
ncbi:MAG TPA: serine/threonine-protein kinase [Kofleriaceae bacterium]|nr:serine/threonine-protein kinase [Kofleriaceae bacterium]